MSIEQLQAIVKTTKDRMTKSMADLEHALSLVRSGRATPALVEDIRVEVYGQHMPLNQVASINIPEARQIVLDVWDKSNMNAVEKAIMASGRNLNPQSDGMVLRINIPELTEERRKEMVKIARTKVEDHKVAIRNIRRDANDDLKKQKGEGISEDSLKQYLNDVQKLTDDYIAKMDKALEHKEKDILTV